MERYRLNLDMRYNLFMVGRSYQWNVGDVSCRGIEGRELWKVGHVHRPGGCRTGDTEGKRQKRNHLQVMRTHDDL
jgi:hypothetical protein